jgi:decaprenyl-phosphate phosphoribosyltransferase
VRPVRWNRWLRAARPHQWIKATLVLTAPLVALELTVAATLRVLVAAALACLAASGTYLLNDAMDVEADRLHPVKRLRPVAAGEVSPRQAIRVAVVLLVAAPLLGLLLSPGTGIALAGYVAVTVVYSLRLKRIAVGDVLAISAGFVLRVLIGSAATSTRVAPWFLVSVAAGAVMVATGKRRGELRELGAGAVTHRSSLLTYQDPVTTKLLAGAAAALCTGLVGWATIGGGGPHLAESWACALLAPALFGVGRYLSLAMSGRAARPERLVRDRWLFGCAVLTVVLFLAGRALS